jgi:hypothetical protein
MNLYLYYVGSVNRFNKSHKYGLYDYVTSVTYWQARGVTSNTYCIRKYIHCSLLPTGTQGLFADSVYWNVFKRSITQDNRYPDTSLLILVSGHAPIYLILSTFTFVPNFLLA